MYASDATQQAVEWFRINEPFIYKVAAKRLEMKNQGLAGIDWGNMLGSITDTVKSISSDLAPQYLNYQQQKRMMDIQIERAKNNQPPVDLPKYQQTFPIAVDNSPESQAVINRTAAQVSSSNQTTTLILGAIGTFALFKMVK